MRWTRSLRTRDALVSLAAVLVTLVASPLGEIVALGYRWT